MRIKFILLSFLFCLNILLIDSCATKKKVVDDEELETPTESKPTSVKTTPVNPGETKKDVNVVPSEDELVDGIIEREKEREKRYEENQKRMQQEKTWKRMKRNKKKSQLYNSYKSPNFFQRLLFYSRK